jgi:hypothetical protein
MIVDFRLPIADLQEQGATRKSAIGNWQLEITYG